MGFQPSFLSFFKLIIVQSSLKSTKLDSRKAQTRNFKPQQKWKSINLEKKKCQRIHFFSLWPWWCLSKFSTKLLSCKPYGKEMYLPDAQTNTNTRYEYIPVGKVHKPNSLKTKSTQDSKEVKSFRIISSHRTSMIL